MVTKPKATSLDLFIEVTNTITSSLNLDEIFKLITQKIPEIINVDAATIRLLDESGKNLKLKAAHGLSQAYLNRGPINTEEPVFRALKGEPIVIDDAAHDPRVHYPEMTEKEGIKNILVVPIPIRGQINGILRLLNKTPRTYTPQEIDFVAAIAGQCGIAIENARIFREQQIQLNYFKAVYDIGKVINATYDLDHILDFIVTRLPDVMDLKAATIRLVGSSMGKLELKAAYGLSQSYLDRGPLDEELATYYVKKGDPVVIPDAKVDLHTIYHKEAESEGIGGILGVPISVRNEIIGILRLLKEQVYYFSEADINLPWQLRSRGALRSRERSTTVNSAGLMRVAYCSRCPG